MRRVPLSPPHTLVLAESTFMPFYVQDVANPPDYLHTTGDALKLREGGQAKQAAFQHEVFDGDLAKLLQHESWAAWRDALRHAAVDQAVLRQWLEDYQTWLACVTARKSAKTAWGTLCAADGNEAARGGTKASVPMQTLSRDAPRAQSAERNEALGAQDGALVATL